jgi:pimeloyl-ACP methyl ester carboxylesterase
MLSMTPPASVNDHDRPAWFTAALATPAEQAWATIDGVAIAYRAWGGPAERGIVLVHGGGAHSRWWDHMAPLLTGGWRVVALDLSGHGDSGRRDSYDLDQWAREVLAVAHAAGITQPVVVGHSMGGYIALRVAALFGAQISGAVIIDSAVRDITPEERAAREHRAFGPLRTYPSREAALARFRPIPDQPTLPYIAAHVAETSIREVDGGWSWKFDPRIFAGPSLTPERLTRLECRLALFHAEHGIVSPQTGEIMYDRLGRAAPVIEIPAAGHHVMLDQPIALVTGIRTLLSDWDHSVPGTPDRA